MSLAQVLLYGERADDEERRVRILTLAERALAVLLADEEEPTMPPADAAKALAGIAKRREEQ